MVLRRMTRRRIDPFKDTSGPAMNILIKLMSIVSLVLAPWFVKVHADDVNTVESLSMVWQTVMAFFA